MSHGGRHAYSRMRRGAGQASCGGTGGSSVLTFQDVQGLRPFKGFRELQRRLDKCHLIEFLQSIWHIGMAGGHASRYDLLPSPPTPPVGNKRVHSYDLGGLAAIRDPPSHRVSALSTAQTHPDDKTMQ